MTTDLYCVMGHPVAHSQSPWIHSRFAELTGQDILYTKRHIPLDHFDNSVRAFIDGGRARLQHHRTVQVRGRSAGHPHQRAGSAGSGLQYPDFDNGRIEADNTDGLGLVDDIEQNAGFSLHGKRVLLMGAGGAAAGVLGPLIHAHPAHISVANRTLHKAAALVARHQALAEASKSRA
jgi:shikimate dehydrogenase